MPIQLEGTTDAQKAADRAQLQRLINTYNTLKNGMNTINADMDNIINGPASPTAAQTGTALKLIAKDIKTTMTGMDTLLDALAPIVRRNI